MLARKSFTIQLIEDLKEKEFATIFMRQVLKDGDPDYLKHSLSLLVESRSLPVISKESLIPLPRLRHILFGSGTPALEEARFILKACELNL